MRWYFRKKEVQTPPYHVIMWVCRTCGRASARRPAFGKEVPFVLNFLNQHLKEHLGEERSFWKWILWSCLVGILVGIVATAFHYGIDLATEIRSAHPWVICFLPVGGTGIVLLYRLCGMEGDRGTNLVLVAARNASPMQLRTAPLIFLSTIMTHLVGGSAGREGAALQLGSAISAWLGKKMKLGFDDRRVFILCGMSAAFSALFGTPITAAIFAMEVTMVGVIYYAAIVPCMTASLTGFLVARFLGLHETVGYNMGIACTVNYKSVIQVSILGIICALASILFCEAMHVAGHLYTKYVPRPALRACVGGILVLLLTILMGNQFYSGAGDGIIRTLLDGETIPQAFLLKILFTALTLGAGFRGGEIVPALTTGCAVGTLFGPLLGLPHGFSGALGMAAVFCGATNCPITATFLAFELFGGRGLPLFAMCCAVSYMLSGYYGLYSEQRFMTSKTEPEFIDKKAE